MGAKTKIEWTDATWNPVTGCTKVSAGCANCYAEGIAKRFTRIGTLARKDLGYKYDTNDFADVLLHPDRLEIPLRWRKPRRIFVPSMGDLFHADVPDEFIAKVFGVMAACPQHTFLVLTKRAERLPAWFRWLSNTEKPGWEVANCEGYYRNASGAGGVIEAQQGAPWPLPNVHLGVSIEDQATANERIPHLLNTPAALRFVSAEPLLGALALTSKLRYRQRKNMDGYGGDHGPGWTTEMTRIDWVICGGESGPNARPSHPDWFRSLRDQCAAAGVAFMFKQWGAWAPSSDQNAPLVDSCGRCTDQGWIAANDKSACRMSRVGKKAAGRLLDGVLHDEIPGVR